MPEKIYDSEHQGHTIRNWKKYGLICRGNETYKDIYNEVMSVTHCELCNVEFTDEIADQRCMDHCHETGFFRKVLCRRCNANYKISKPKTKKKTTSGFSWISRNVTKNTSGSISIGFRYERKGFKRKGSTSLTKLIALSFIHLLKEPI